MLLVHRLTLVAGILAVALAGTASAKIQTHGPENFPGPNEISVHFPGFSDGTGSFPSGFFVSFDYARHLKERLWFDVGADIVAGGSGGRCLFPGDRYACGFGNNGSAFEPFAGVKIKFPTAIPLVPYVKADGVLSIIVNRPCEDNGFGPLARVGGGVKYFLTDRIGLGVEGTFTFGLASFGSGVCPNGDRIGSTWEFVFSTQWSAGAEFIF